MDAIFEYSMDYMYDSIRVFGSYMEKASLQFNIELEEYVESVLNYNSSSSLVVLEASKNGLIEKIQKGTENIISKIKTFWQDTKNNITKYVIDKKIENKVKKIENKCKGNKHLQKLKINHKDFSAKKKFLKREKESLKKLFEKKGKSSKEKSAEAKKIIENVKKKLKEEKFVKHVIIEVSIYASLAFFKGIMDEFRKDNESINSDLERIRQDGERALKTIQNGTNRTLEEAKRGMKVNESAEDSFDESGTVELINDYQNFINEITKAFSYIFTEEIGIIREEMKEYVTNIEKIESNKLFSQNTQTNTAEDNSEKLNEQTVQQFAQASNIFIT